IRQALHEDGINGELDGIDGRAGPEIVHARLEALFPAIKVHGGEFGGAWVPNVDVKGLTLVDKSATVSGHVNNGLLADFPDGPVEGADSIWEDGQAGNGAIVGEDEAPDLVVPEPEGHEVLEQVRINDLELTSKDTTGVDVARVR